MANPFGTDEILWYRNGAWGDLGYAVPNFGSNPTTLNQTIGELVQVMGRNLSAVMHHSDADSRTPPSINTLIRVHKLVTRARSILASRAVPPGKPRMEPSHSTPSREAFLIFPVPWFKVRSTYLKSWAGLVLTAIGECCQHTENRIEYEVSTDFASLIGQYLQRIYVRMATELFQVPLADASKPDFVLTDVMFAAYDPSKWFTSTELIDTVPAFNQIPTEDDLQVLTDGIPATVLVGLARWPVNVSESIFPSTSAQTENGTAAAVATAAAAASAVPSFPPPPSP